MGYEDRDYFREQPRVGFETPRLGKASKVLLGLLVFGFLLSIVGGASGSPSRDLQTAGKVPLVEALSLSSHALLPIGESWPKSWQLLTSALMFNNVVSLLLAAIIGVWLLGSAMERDMGTRNYVKFLIGAQLASAVAAALIDPFLGNAMTGSTMVYSMGIGSLFSAMLAGIAAYRGDQPGLLGWKIRTWVILLLIVNLVFSITGYRPLTGSKTILVVQSLPGTLAGAAFGWFVLRGMAGRRLVSNGIRRVVKEEDFGAYVRKVSGESEEPSPDTVRRARDRRRVERETRRREEEQQALDTLLERISKEGISSLSRSEKAFLERVSKRKREEDGF